MKLLAFSDLHRDREQARRLAERASAEADVLVGAGDYATWRLGLNRIIDTLSATTVPAVLVPGNHETDSALWRACGGWTGAHVLHGEATTIAGTAFFGLGGAVPPAPLPWSFDRTEAQTALQLEDAPPRAVLVVHSPPHGVLDEAFGRHLGSHAIREAIERLDPVLVVCGHIHQAAGQEARIEGVRVVNPGPEGRLIDL